MPEEPSQAPTAEGTLSRTPFSHLLVYVADRRLSGSLRLLSPEGQDAALEHIVVFDSGAPAKVRTGESTAYLGRVLFELGLIGQEELDRSLVEVARTRELHGQYLLRTGAIDPVALEKGLRAQAVRKLGYLFQLPPTTRFAFYADLNLLSDWGGSELLALDPLPLVWHAVRSQPHEPRVDAMLARLGAVVLRLHPQSDVSRFGFSASESAAIDLIRASPQPLESLLRCAVATDRSVRLMVYTLLLTRHLDHGPSAVPVGYKFLPSSAPMRGMPGSTGANVARMELKTQFAVRSNPAPAGDTAGSPAVAAGSPAVAAGSPAVAAPPLVSCTPGSVSAASAPPPSLSPELQARHTAIIERAASIDQEDYFSMLGLSRDADSRAIESVYISIAKAWHPDRLPPELSDLKTQCSKIFSRMNEAYNTLSDAEARARYLEILKGGSGTPEESERIQKIVGATADFQRAEVFLRKHDLVNARRHIELAREADPEQAEYTALYAQVLLAARTEPNADLGEISDLLERAIAADPRCTRAYLARADVRKRIGRIDEAMADFRCVVELNPKNVDAQRELRLYEMRRRSKGPDARVGSSDAGRHGAPKVAGPSAASASASAKSGGVLSGLQKLFKG